MSETRTDDRIPDNSTRAAMIALNRAIDAFYEAEAGHRMTQAAKLMRAVMQCVMVAGAAVVLLEIFLIKVVRNLIISQIYIFRRWTSYDFCNYCNSTLQMSKLHEFSELL